ncbi:tectonic-3 [Pelodytes ibericus]
MEPVLRVLLLVTALGSGVGICTCDLSPGVCDINCCCDPDCSSAAPTSVFSSCLPGSTKAQTQVCLYSWLIFRSNTPYSTVRISSSSPRTPELFCVIPGDASLNYFVTPQPVNGTNLSNLTEKYKGLSFSPVSAPSPALPNFYKAGDPILTLSASNAMGVLRQPSPVGAQNICADPNPARFLQSGTTSCLRLISNLTCLSDPWLDNGHYHQGFRVLRVPIDAPNKTGLSVTVTGSLVSRPTLEADRCDNVISQVIYSVLYNGTQGITGVSVQLHVLSVPFSSQFLQQSFTVLYKSVSAPAGSSDLTRSGNPGYLVPFPVLSDNGSLSLLSSEADGSCIRRPVQFGVNAVSGCSISGSALGTCSEFRDRAFTVLAGDSSPQSLASFGNATTAQSGDWVAIIYQNCSSQDLGNCSTGCLLPVLLHMQILWAKVGLLSNPQAQIQGARFQYSCRFVQCLDNVLLQTQVSFTEVTRRGPAPRSSPAPEDREPLDFFYPFRSNRAAGEHAAPFLHFTLLLLSLVLLI